MADDEPEAPEEAAATEDGAEGVAPSGVLLTIAYLGTAFAGFAPQPGQRTVGGELLGALRALDPHVRELRGASRTDAGVHARGQRVAFDPSAPIPPRGWVLGTQRHLPDEIAVRRAERVPRGLSPRFANAGKRYRYTLLCDEVRDPWWTHRAWRIDALDDAAIARARAEASAAMGTHDFAAFRSAADERQNTTRTLRTVAVTRDTGDARLVHVDVDGTAFLHNMVRILVGTLVDVARGRRPPGAVARALASRDRRDAGLTAPPDGLYLEAVHMTVVGEQPWPP